MATFNPVEAHCATSQRLKETLSAEVQADRKTMPFTHGLLAGLFRGLGVVSADAAAHIAALEARVAALERQQGQQRALPYRGVWRSADTYRPGDLATFRGSMWHCNRTATGDEPGADLTTWTLCVKRGRDGRNADRSSNHGDN